MSTNVGVNWARNYEYTAAQLVRPTTIGEVQDLVAAADRLRALGSRHSFTDLADSSGTLLSLDALDTPIDIDEQNGTVTVGGGVLYGDLATVLQDAGWALHNLASLPHISIAGAVATGTHGSGSANGSLSSAVRAIDLIGADGEIVTVAHGDGDFAGSVVALGALGIAARVTLAVEPTYRVRQDVYADLDWSTALADFDAVSGCGYSVSLFTRWLGDTVPRVDRKSTRLNSSHCGTSRMPSSA